MRTNLFPLLAAFGLAVSGATAAAKLSSVQLRAKAVIAGKTATSVPIVSGQGISVPLGTAIIWAADINNSNGGAVWYRFRVTGPDGVQRMIRDFGPNPELSWTSIDAEGAYEMEVTARKLGSAEVTVDSVAFRLLPIATTGPVVKPTTHPQVLLYGAPPCAAGARMKVQFMGPSGNTEETPEKSCGGLTMNFYVGGLRKQSTYQLWHVINDANGKRTVGPAVTEMSGTPTYQFADPTFATPAAAGAVNPVILYGSLFEPIHATDLAGNILWYYLSELTTVTHTDGNGRFWGFGESPMLGPDSQVIRLFDLAGSTILETNAARVNEQLALIGKATIGGFHHEVRPLADGTILVLASVDQIMNRVQGADGDVDILGDMILVLNRDMQVLWAWNSFDYLYPARAAILGEQCAPGGAGCAPFYKANMSNDWTHGNSLQLTADGNILYSVRHQDWVIKIDYENGGGSGQIIWKMGVGGDFSINSNDPSPWFSHQHDANFDATDPTVLYVFDNGNTRRATDPSANSRGQAYKIDEQARTATPILNADLGDFSMALGSAAKLPNGNYHFDLGWIPQSYGPTSRVVEVDPSGKIVYEIRTPTAFYRAFRLASLYAAESR